MIVKEEPTARQQADDDDESSLSRLIAYLISSVRRVFLLIDIVLVVLFQERSGGCDIDSVLSDVVRRRRSFGQTGRRRSPYLSTM